MKELGTGDKFEDESIQLFEQIHYTHSVQGITFLPSRMQCASAQRCCWHSCEGDIMIAIMPAVSKKGFTRTYFVQARCCSVGHKLALSFATHARKTKNIPFACLAAWRQSASSALTRMKKRFCWLFASRMEYNVFYKFYYLRIWIVLLRSFQARLVWWRVLLFQCPLCRQTISSSKFLNPKIQYEVKSPLLVTTMASKIVTSKSSLLFHRLRMCGVFNGLNVNEDWWRSHLGKHVRSDAGQAAGREDIASKVIIFSKNVEYLDRQCPCFVENAEFWNLCSRWTFLYGLFFLFVVLLCLT